MVLEEKGRDHQKSNSAWEGNEHVEQIPTVCPIWIISLKAKEVNIMVALEEKSEAHQGHQDLSTGDHKCIYILWQIIQWILRYFALDQSGEPTDPHH